MTESNIPNPPSPSVDAVISTMENNGLTISDILPHLPKHLTYLEPEVSFILRLPNDTVLSFSYRSTFSSGKLLDITPFVPCRLGMSYPDKQPCGLLIPYTSKGE